MHEVHNKQFLIVHCGLCCKGNTKGAAPKAAVVVRETLIRWTTESCLKAGEMCHVSFHLAQLRNIKKWRTGKSWLKWWLSSTSIGGRGVCLPSITHEDQNSGRGNWWSSPRNWSKHKSHSKVSKTKDAHKYIIGDPMLAHILKHLAGR